MPTKAKTIHRQRLLEANQYANYCLKHGYHIDDGFEEMTEAEKIDWAERTMAKADLAYDAWKEQEEVSL